MPGSSSPKVGRLSTSQSAGAVPGLIRIRNALTRIRVQVLHPNGKYFYHPPIRFSPWLSAWPILGRLPAGPAEELPFPSQGQAWVELKVHPFSFWRIFGYVIILMITYPLLAGCSTSYTYGVCSLGTYSSFSKGCRFLLHKANADIYVDRPPCPLMGACCLFFPGPGILPCLLSFHHMPIVLCASTGTTDPAIIHDPLSIFFSGKLKASSTSPFPFYPESAHPCFCKIQSRSDHSPPQEKCRHGTFSEYSQSLVYGMKSSKLPVSLSHNQLGAVG